jgi:hypothetical protein
MVGRGRITFALALLVTVLSMIGRAYLWIAIPTTLFAVFLLVWGREGRRTEAVIGQLPLRFGYYLLKALKQLDLILSPRDLEYEQQITKTITDYDDSLRKALRILLKTRKPNNISTQQWERFFEDSLAESPFNMRGGVKSELREVVGHVLDDLGV